MRNLDGWQCGDVLRVYGVGALLLDGMKAFYRDASVCVKVKWEVGESFRMQEGPVRQGHVMST